MEVWKSIATGYEVSSLGRIKSYWRGKPRILKLTLVRGYWNVGLMIDGKQKHFSVHRLVATAFVPNPEGKPQVNHINGIKTDNRVENLEWTTVAENTQHAYDNNLAKSGEDNYLAKLTNVQAQYVRENPNNLTGRELAKKFAVDETVISLIQRGKAYKHAGGSIREGRKRSTLTDAQRKEIRAKRAAGAKFKDIANEFGLHLSTVYKIIYNSCSYQS